MEGVLRKEGWVGLRSGSVRELLHHEGEICILTLMVALLIYRCDKMPEDYTRNMPRKPAHAHTREI